VLKFLRDVAKYPSDRSMSRLSGPWGPLGTITQTEVSPYFGHSTFKYHFDPCQAAAKNGHLEVIRWLLANKCPWDVTTVGNGAAKHGHLKVLQFAIEKGFHPDESTCAAVASKGNLRMLKWLRKQNCPWNRETCDQAANKGHLFVLQWAAENGCPVDATTTQAAASGVHLEPLRWLVERGCPWNVEICNSIVDRWKCLNNPKHVEKIKEWMYWRLAKERGCPERDVPARTDAAA